jgi:HK97 gp10 family phage protein
MISFEALGQAILEAASEALGEGANIVAARARSLAPVRHIFRGGGSSIRPQSAPQSSGISPLGTGSLNRATQVVSVARPPVNWRGRRLAAATAALESYDEGDRSTLTRRGAYEVRQALAHPKPGSRSPTGRLSPSFATFQHLNVGGRLRGEIRAIPATLAGSRAEAWVISPTRYAKYQEFGTRHNAAHPFLRPAAAESRAEVVSRIAAAVTEAARTGSGKTEIEIMVRL